MAQLDMFGQTQAQQTSASADPDRVRRKLQALLAEARNAGPKGLPEPRRRFIATVVPQMVRWLTEEEAKAIQAEFKAALS